MTEFDHNCRAKTDWAELGPDSIHAYRVTCAACRKFIKWGTAAQLSQANRDGLVRRTCNYKSPATLQAFLA